MTLEIITALTAFAFVSTVTPGPNNLMLMTSGIHFGIARTIPHILGINLGLSLMIFLIGVGLIHIFNLFPISFTILKIVSVTYLTYLAWKIATSDPLNKQSKTKNTKPMTFMQAALFQWVNPKAWVMAITAISTYAPSPQSFKSILLVVLVFALISGPSISLWVFLGAQLQRFLSHPLKMRIFNIVAALLLMASLIPVLF